MDSLEIMDGVRGIVADIFECDPGTLSAETRLMTDLPCESIDLLEIGARLGQTFRVPVDDEAAFLRSLRYHVSCGGDPEAVIRREDRNIAFLQETVKRIYAALKETADRICAEFPALDNYLAEEISFVTTQQLEDTYPDKTPKERELAYVRAHGAAFIMQIGGRLRSGQKHDGRAPDYDDWSLNGDIVLYYPVLDCAFEISSMGIRVDEESLLSQLKEENCLDRLQSPFHKALAAGELPLTMGGGIGQSRLCMFLLGKMHIGEVQVSLWDKKTEQYCRENNITLM